ncbi:MAG: glycerol-3-phosphate responsive antiterminator, partial [Spirochaetales bacterium]|nr:glycerol-3-phosphate responsive antiterminator [Spirochaetales bacterium]
MRTEEKFPFGEVIAATRTESDFLAAIESEVDTVFDLAPDIMTVAPRLKAAHTAGKKLFLHIDLSKGLGRDESGIKYLKFLGIDGINSTKSSMIKNAREIGLITVQRF